MNPRRPVLAALLAALPATGWTAAAGAQDAPCAPRIEVAADTPARVASRLHALARALPPADGDGCHATRVRFAWTPQRLTVEVALEDGRIANRTLRSLDDALPTLLAVLSETPEPPTTPLPSAAVPAVPASPRSPPEAAPNRALPAPAALSVPAPGHGGWRFVAATSMGLTTPVVRDAPLYVVGAEAGFASPRLRLALRATYGFRGDLRRGARDDGTSDGPGPSAPPGASQGAANGPLRSPASGLDVREVFAGASARYRTGLGRFRLEAGGSAGVAWTRARDADRTYLRYALRVGLESVLGLPLPLGTEVFLRGEFYTDLYPHDDVPSPVGETHLTGMLSLGVGWGAPR